MSDHSSYDRVDRKILQFWINNPGGKGTPQIIVDWWLPRKEESLSEVQVKESLNRLVLKEWIVVRETRSVPKIFGLNPLKIQEVREFLESEEIEEPIVQSNNKAGAKP